ncbi:unnamed protein product [Arctia plantaginis]|uniref:Peptidase S1 domain-containing protein n=1 Tax=Arctia plantaginis TaxID=874455 RepID=A0A8S1BFI0_ARCPL|nr:unnamed protein product [Arctia plantaginis]
MYKVLIFSVCLSVCLSFVTCDLDKEEGEDCEWDGIKGKCVHPSVCLTTLDKRRAKPPVCSQKGDETIICCTDCELVNDTSNFIISPSSGVLWKDGRKSRDACLQYLKDLPHKCRQEGYYAGLSRKLDEEKKCHRFSLWVIGGAPGPGARVPSENPYEAVVGFGQGRDMIYWMSAGSIIHEKFVLTAAHRLNASSIPDRPLTYVALGVKNMDRSTWEIHNVTKIHVHPDYDGDQSRYNDIALLELETPISFNRDVLPACLPDPAEEFDTSKAKFTSWLRNDSDPIIKGPFDSPHVVELREFTAEECNANMENVDPLQSYIYRIYLPNKVNEESQVCYGPENCMYIMGGPIAVTTQYSRCMNTVIGISPFDGHQCAPTVFTKVQHFVSWIESIVWP